MFSLKLHFGILNTGFSERYYLSSSGVSDAKTKAAAIIAARLACLNSATELLWANVSDELKKRDSYNVLPTGSRVGALGDATYMVNRPQDGILVRFETADGKSSNRVVHGIPDRNIVEGAYVTGIGGDSFPTALTAFLDAVKTNTVHQVSRSADVPPVIVTAAYDNYAIRSITSRKTGRPFDAPRGRRAAGL